MNDPIILDEIIDARAAQEIAHIRVMVDEFLMSIGFSRAFCNRSRGQRLRFERERKEANGR